MAGYRQLEADYVLVGDDADEDLAAPADSDPLWWRRARRPVGVLLVLLASGGLVLRVTAGGGGDRAAAERTAAESPAVVHPVHDIADAPPLDRVAAGLVSDDLDSACPVGESCRNSTQMPSGVAAALAATFPGYSQATARTVTLASASGERMLGRFVHVVTATADVTVQVLAQAAHPSTVLTGEGAAAIVVVERAAGAVTVRITVGGPGASAARNSPPVRLARDPRLVRLP